MEKVIKNGVEYVKYEGRYYEAEPPHEYVEDPKINPPYLPTANEQAVQDFLDADTDEETDEETDDEDIGARFGDEDDRYSIFLRAKSWKPYPPARAKKGEKGRAEYKKEGRVGFFDDFPEVPYWQGQLGLELYMDKVDFMEGKKKKRKKVAKDRLTDRTYMYNPDTKMYEEQTQADGYPDAAETAIKVFNNKVCLAEQQGLQKLRAYYDLPEGLKELNYYLEEQYDDLFDCNCNHLGKFSGETLTIVGQANRYDWVKSEVELGMFLAREQVNTILFELNNYQNDPSKYGFDEDLLDYEKQYAEGIQGKGDHIFGNETSKLVAFQASPTAPFDSETATTEETGEYFGQQGYGSVKLVDIRTEEEKLMKYDVLMGDDEDEPPRQLFRETNKINKDIGGLKVLTKANKGITVGVKKKFYPIKEVKAKKPRTEAQLAALAAARARLAKKKEEFKKKESEK